MTQLYEIKVSLSPNQRKNLSNAYHKKETIVLRLTKDALSGNDTLLVPKNVANRLAKNRQIKKGMDIKLAKTSIRKQVGYHFCPQFFRLEKRLHQHWQKHSAFQLLLVWHLKVHHRLSKKYLVASSYHKIKSVS